MQYGLHKWIEYFTSINPTAAGDDLTAADPVEAMIRSGRAVIGTPDDAIEQLRRLEQQSGGFGCFLQLAHDWANWENTQKSYELWTRHVVPAFRGANLHRVDSLRWAKDNAGEFIGAAIAAAQQMFVKHAEEEASKAAARPGERGDRRAS